MCIPGATETQSKSVNAKPSMSVADVIVAVQMERAQELEHMISNKSEKLKALNAEMARNRQMISELKGLKNQHGVTKIAVQQSSPGAAATTASQLENDALRVLLQKAETADSATTSVSFTSTAYTPNRTLTLSTFTPSDESPRGGSFKLFLWMREHVQEFNSHYSYQRNRSTNPDFVDHEYNLPTDQAKFDAMTQAMDGLNTDLSATSQMEMIEFQSLTNKYNQSFDMMTNFIQKNAGSLDKTIGNLR